jgi:alanine dehydrogenase
MEYKMITGILKEIKTKENRVSMTPLILKLELKS